MKPKNWKGSWTKCFVLGFFACIPSLSVLLAPQDMQAAGGKPSKKSPELTALKEAEQHYNRGLEYKAKACVYSMQVEENEKDANPSLIKKAKAEFNQAIREFSKATKKNPKHYQAFSELGYSYRKIGKYTDSLKSYNQALSINEKYAQAIEYRAVAYLYLNRLQSLKKDYITLTRLDTDLSKQLLKEIEKWLIQVKAVKQDASSPVSSPASNLDPKELTEFEAWIKEMSTKI